MTLTESVDIDTVRDVLGQHPVRLAILFGSHATGAEHAGSDIDIAVEFDACQPSDPEYNDVFFGLSADLSDALGTDDLDLVDIHTVSPSLVRSIMDDGVLLVGDSTRATELQQQRTAIESEQRSPRERFDAALASIDAHLGTEDTATAPDESETEG